MKIQSQLPMVSQAPQKAVQQKRRKKKEKGQEVSYPRATTDFIWCALNLWTSHEEYGKLATKWYDFTEVRDRCGYDRFISIKSLYFCLNESAGH